MKLNMSDIQTLKNLLSPEMYTAYIKYTEGGLLDSEETKVKSKTTNKGLNDNIMKLLSFKILRKALYYAPILTGELRDSSYIKEFGSGYEIGFTADHAIYAHEIGTNMHNNPTQYKYLEDAAFEVLEEYYNETGTVIPIKITYDPLRVFVGDSKAPGENLAKVKFKEDVTRNESNYTRMLNKFLNFDKSNASQSDIVYYNKMNEFFDYYRTYRHLSDWVIIQEWVDRNRHN